MEEPHVNSVPGTAVGSAKGADTGLGPGWPQPLSAKRTTACVERLQHEPFSWVGILSSPSAPAADLPVVDEPTSRCQLVPGRLLPGGVGLEGAAVERFERQPPGAAVNPLCIGLSSCLEAAAAKLRRQVTAGGSVRECRTHPH